MEELTGWLQGYGKFTLMLAFWVSVIVSTFDATRRIASFGVSKRLALYVLGNVVLAAAVGSFYFWAHRTEVQLVAKLDYRHVQLPRDWAKDQPPASRHKGSKAYATMAFRGEGLLLKHLDDTGNWVQFQPTAEDIAQRDYAVGVTTRLAEQSQIFWRLALEWWLGCLIAGALGFATGHSTKMAANSTVERDARNSGARPSP